MAVVSVLDRESKQSEELILNDAVFGVKANLNVLRESLARHLACRHQGTASTKTRGEVAGGGAKPYRQKGTGRARAGSIRSPLWRHGGVTFGPKPRSYSFKMNKKKRRLAIKSALSLLVEEKRLSVVKELSIGEPKTRALVGMIEGMGLEGKILILLEQPGEEIRRSARNVPYIRVLPVENINIFDLLYCDNVLTTEGTVRALEGILK